MNVQERVQQLIGSQMVQLVALQTQLEDAQKRIEELEAAMKPPASPPAS